MKFCMQNQTKNLEFFIYLKKCPRDDLILAKKHFPTLSRAYKTRWGQWSLTLNFFSTLGALVQHTYVIVYRNRKFWFHFTFCIWYRFSIRKYYWHFSKVFFIKCIRCYNNVLKPRILTMVSQQSEIKIECLNPLEKW